MKSSRRYSFLPNSLSQMYQIVKTGMGKGDVGLCRGSRLGLMPDVRSLLRRETVSLHPSGIYTR